MNDQSPRHLPQWSWVVAVLFFPSGLFLAYGSAKLLSWWRAVLLALLSYGCLVGFVQLMVHLERRGASGLVHSIAILGGLAMLGGWGFVLYRIGQCAEYWSPTAQRVWRRAGWFAVAVLCIACVGVGFQFIGDRLHGS